MNNEIELFTNKFIRILKSMSYSTIIQGDPNQREDWLRTLSRIEKELGPYSGILKVENHLERIANKLNNMSEEERKIYITDNNIQF